MSFLVRCEFVLDDGQVLHDETVLAEISTLQLLEKGIHLLGLGHGTLRITFDPPLVAEVAAEDQAA